MFRIGGKDSENHIDLFAMALPIGCKTMPVDTMTDSQLQHEYLEKSSDLADGWERNGGFEAAYADAKTARLIRRTNRIEI